MGRNDDEGRISNLIITGGDGETSAIAQQRMLMGTEKHPCARCKKWAKDTAKKARHLVFCGLFVNPQTGAVTSPMHKDNKLKGMDLNVNNLGWCRLELRVTENQATCPAWVPKDNLAKHLATR
jgi:hypothetical protein